MASVTPNNHSSDNSAVKKRKEESKYIGVFYAIDFITLDGTGLFGFSKTDHPDSLESCQFIYKEWTDAFKLYDMIENSESLNGLDLECVVVAIRYTEKDKDIGRKIKSFKKEIENIKESVLGGDE